MSDVSRTEEPPVAAPDMTLIPGTPDFWHALIAGVGPTYAASNWPASSAVVSCVPLLKIDVLSVTFLPRSLVKKPLSTPTSAGACVTVARKPSRSGTRAAAEPGPRPDEAGQPQ